MEKLELKDTVNEMISTDYRERFIAEYFQLKIRTERLERFIQRIEASAMSDNVPKPKHDCPLHLLESQLHYMKGYLNNLKLRALIEGIILD